MVDSPFFGSAYSSRSTNLADQLCINIYPEIVETKSGRNVGGFYMAPGLDLLATVGAGPIRGMVQSNAGLTVVSGNEVYFLNDSFTPSLLGTIATTESPVSMIANKQQVDIFDGTNGYFTTDFSTISFAAVSAPGSGYVPGQTIMLPGGILIQPVAGVLTVVTTQVVTAVANAGGSGGSDGLQVMTGTTGTGTKFQVLALVTGGAVVGVVGVADGGSYTVNPTSLSAEPVTGGGVTGATVTIVMGVNTVSITNAGEYFILPANPTPQNSTSGSGTGASFALTFELAISPVLFPLTLPFPNPTIATSQDGFGLVAQGGTDVWWQSALFDYSTWDPLNFTSAAAIADNIVALADLHREVWVLKQNNAEVWDNAGQPGFTFAILQGVLPEVGCIAPFSVANTNESLIWLAQNTQGKGVVVQSEGYQAKRISTHAIEHAINTYARIDDAIAYSYQQEGHVFYVLTFPTGNATWVYDVTTSALAGMPMWHQRAALENGQLNRHWGNAYCYFAGQNILGDYRNGNLYRMNLDTELDAGTQRKWVRSWNALPKSEDNPQRFNSLEIDMQTGIGVPDGTNPLAILRWSDDGGHTWSNEKYAPVGPPGATAIRVIFRRLGSTRRDSGMARIFELSSTDAFGVALIGAERD